MNDFIDYIQRWISTKTSNLVGNIVMSGMIVCITCLAVKNDVFSTYGATRTCLFSILMCCIWSGMFNSVALFYSERDYTPDDLNKFLSVKTYIAANFLIQTLLCVVESTLSAVIFSLFFSYENDGILFGHRSLDFLLAFFLITLSADLLGLLVGMLINSITSIMTVIPVILIVQLLLSGCLFELDGFMEKTAVITTAHWGFYALGAIADLNSFLPYGSASPVFRSDLGYITYCFMHLILLIMICAVLSGIILYTKVNRIEN